MDGLAGKKAKLQDAALLNQAGSFVRYSKADWTFPGVSITAPSSNSDTWAHFNLTDLPGAKTYPVATVSLMFTSQILTERGRRMHARWPEAAEFAIMKCHMSDSSSILAHCHALEESKTCFFKLFVSVSSRSSEKVFSTHLMP